MSHRTHDLQDQDGIRQWMPGPAKQEQTPIHLQPGPTDALQRARNGQSSLGPSQLLALQGVLGNRAVQRLVADQPAGQSGRGRIQRAISNQMRSRSLRISIQQTNRRQTTKTDFASTLKKNLNKTADVVLAAGQLAAPYIPGGSVLSAATSGQGQLKSSIGAKLDKSAERSSPRPPLMQLQAMQIQNALNRNQQIFSSITNMMKTYHNTAKSVISNLK